MSNSSRGSQSVQLVLQSFFLSLFQKSTGHVHRVSTESFFTSCNFASFLTIQSPSDEVSWTKDYTAVPRELNLSVPHLSNSTLHGESSDFTKKQKDRGVRKKV